MQETIKNRIKWILALIIIGFPFLVFRFFQIQYILYEHYSELSKRNLDRYKDVAPRRGSIYDRKGHILVKTSPCYNLVANMAGLFPGENDKPESLQEESIENLVEMLTEHGEDITVEEITEKVLKIYEKVQIYMKNALVSHEELKKRNFAKYLTKKKDIKKDFYNRTYIVLKNISFKAALAFYINKSSFALVSENKADF